MFRADWVYEKKLVDVGGGILISEPLVVEMGLRVEGNYSFASLSHQEMLVICPQDGKYIIQFTNPRKGKQV